MNIFILDSDIEQCARYHCDQHVGKMILESTQILCTALNKKGFETPYRSTHVKHPCVLWVEASHDNFCWLIKLAYAPSDEFNWRFRRDRNHASIAVLQAVENISFDAFGMTPFVQAIPEQYKVPDDPVAAYRAFYCGEKSRFATWTRREKPDWFLPGNKA